MNTHTSPKDFFLHLGAAIALYTATIALLNLCFSIVDYAYPDQLAGYFSASSIAWPISMMIVLVPALYVLEWALVRDIRKVPEKREIWVRRWRIYLTIFLAGATILGDLITLIYTYLSGEISSRFVWKVVAVLVVCAVVFAYYLLAKAADEAHGRTARRTIAAVGIVVVLAAVVGGFMAVGSPMRQRDLRMDAQRTDDLSTIQWQVVDYWQRTGKLPADLSALNDQISGTTVPTDPDTSAAYEYSASSSPISSAGPSFTLCATFSQPSPDGEGRGAGMNATYASPVSSAIYPGSSDDTWDHATGRECFQRTIDPARYQPTKAAPAGS